MTSSYEGILLDVLILQLISISIDKIGFETIASSSNTFKINCQKTISVDVFTFF